MKFPAVLLCCALPAFAADPRGDSPDAPPSTPQEQLAKFKVPPGFEVQLVAAEPEIQKPMNLNFDAAGRLWVTGSELYPWPAKVDALGQPIANFDQVWANTAGSFDAKKAPPPPEKATDTVRVLSDFGPDGRARQVRVFADGLNIPIGIQPLPRGSSAITALYEAPPRFDPNPAEPKPAPVGDRHVASQPKGDSVIVYSIPNIWLLTDWNGDGKADKREPLYTGFDFRDTHGMSSNYYYWIDGWIYGCHGFRNRSEVRDRHGKVTVFDSGNTYRFRPDGSAIEYWSHGQTNPFGLAFDELGNLYSADSHSKPVMLLLRGGYYEGIGKQHDGLGFAPRITDDDHGSSAIAGLAVYADDKWPEEFRGDLFNGNPVTRRINRAKLEWHGSSPRAIRQPDFLTCDDPWFRPIQVKLGPDGALYIADFYNPIIGHYEAPLADPRRDRTRGRIWRVVWKGDANPSGGAQARGGAEPPGSAGLRPVGGDILSPRTSPETAPAPPDDWKDTSAELEVRRDGTSRPTGQRPALPSPLPDLTRLDAAGLVEKLADPNLVVRTLATHEFVTRFGKEAEDLLLEPIIGKELIAALPASLQPDDIEESKRKTGFAQLDSSVRRYVHAMWILHRANALDVDGTWAIREHPAGTVRTHYMRLLAEHFRDHPESRGNELGAVIQGLYDSNAMCQRAALETASVSTSSHLMLHIESLKSSADDLAFRHMRFVAMRNLLSLPDGYATAWAYADEPMFDASLSADFAAQASLGAVTENAGWFCLWHLKVRGFGVPRASEYLKHAALHIPAERFGEVTAVLNGTAPLAPKDAIDSGANYARSGIATAKAFTLPLTQKLPLADALGQAARERKLKLPDDAAAWVQRVTLEALQSDDAAVLDQAIAAVRDANTAEKAGPLRAIVRRAGEHGLRRAAALEALMNLPESREVAAQALADPSSMTLRKKAADLLAGAGTDAARAALLAALPTAPRELAGNIATGLAKTPEGAAALLRTIEDGRAAADLLQRKPVATALAQSTAGALDLEVRAALLTIDLPPEDARLDKLIAERAELFRAKPGNAYNGSALFQKHCAACHRFRNVSQSNVGPNLDSVAARGAHRLIEDILDPNRNVDPAFRQTIVETYDGRTFAGGNVRDEGQTLRLTDATGQDVTVPKDAIKTQTASRLSLMPPAFEAQLSPEELNDLLRYLLE